MNNENKGIIFPQINLSLSFDRSVKKSELFKITRSSDSHKVFSDVFSKDTFDWREEMIMLCLSRANSVLGFYKVSSGGMSGTVCDPKIIFTVALNCGASGIILAHNHPSGNLQPSKADIDLTRRIREGARLLDLQLLDHLIMTSDTYFSFADEGVL